jgi:hypothetical protein
LRVLIKEPATEQAYMYGQSDQNHTVLVPKEQIKQWGLYEVQVDSVTPHTMFGSVVGQPVEAIPLALAM